VVEPVAVIVPCYLPNEAPIIRGTIEHILENLEHVQNLTVYLVYNTPTDMAEEAELQEMAQPERQRPGRRLVVQRVMGSTSKAENLNDVLSALTEKYVAIYDADHCPNPDSLALAVCHLKRSGADCVQGSTYIRKGLFPFRAFVCAEFFVNYFVVLPAMQVITGTGFFGGANGVWLASSLKQLQFDEKALTEDIECFARAIVKNRFKFEFLPESCSGELLPAGPRAFWRQRLRWCMGWDQVTLRHATAFWRADIRLRIRMGLWYIFFCRWISQLCAVIVVLFNARAALQWQLAETDEDVHNLKVPSCIQHLQFASFCGYMVFIIYSASYALFHRHLAVLPGLLLYFMIMPFYVVFNSCMLTVSLFRVATGNTGGWVVTSRATGAALFGEEPLLGIGADVADACSQRVLAIGFVTMGAIAGAVVGDVVGTHEEVLPLWGWVPFGLGATTTYVTDGRVVAACSLAGMALGLVFFYAAMWVARRKNNSGC